MAIGLDAFGITFLAKELARLLTGQSIRAVMLGADKVLTIELTGRRSVDLKFLHEATFPLLCVAKPEKTSLSQAGRDMPGLPRFEEHLVGCTISDVSQIDLDRIIMVTVQGHGDRIWRLYFELLPPFPSLFLTDGTDTLVEPLFKAGTRTRRRTLARGRPYSLPSADAKVHPVDVTPQTFAALNWRHDAEVLSKAILGISPFLSREIVSRGRQAGSIFEAFGNMLAAYKDRQVEACTFDVAPSISRNPPPIGLAWYRPSPELAAQVSPAASLNRAVQKVMNDYLKVTAYDRTKMAVTRSLVKAIRRLDKTIRQTADAGKEQQAAARYRRFGDILMASLTRIRKGAHEVRLPDLYSADHREITIELEPRLTPHANAEVYFKKAKKSERRACLVERRLTAARSRLRELTSLLAEAEQPGTELKRLKAIVAALSTAAVSGKPKGVPTDDRAARLGIKPRRYSLSDGWTALVGRSAKENDILTHRYASPGDLWFHARHAQGSHVVLRKERRKSQVSRQAILEAAALAAYYSKARTSKHVPVSYTEKRYVRRVRKGPPGTCIMLREKVVFVDPTLPR
jgi:predicted ribosome quality control (RQC) complex YloA/Tae2 family protein